MWPGTAPVGELRQKVDETTLPVTVGDMARATVAGEFSLVYLVWNSISNLRTREEQVECFRNAARHLTHAGRAPLSPPIRGSGRPLIA